MLGHQNSDLEGLATKGVCAFKSAFKGMIGRRLKTGRKENVGKIVKGLNNTLNVLQVNIQHCKLMISNVFKVLSRYKVDVSLIK